MNRTHCQAARWQPTMINPGGDCSVKPPTMAAPLGDTGRWLALCSGCAPRFRGAVPISEVPEEP